MEKCVDLTQGTLSTLISDIPQAYLLVPSATPPTNSEIPRRNWTLTPTLPNLSALCICPVLLCGSVLVLITIIAQISFSSTFSHTPIYYHDTSVVVTVFGTSCLALVGYYKAQIPEPKFPIDVSLHITGQ